MCNAWHHSHECECGFGPPHAVWGKIKFGKKEEWSERIVSSKKALQKGLHEVGFDSQTINNTLNQYLTAKRKRWNLKLWLKKILDRRTYVDEESKILHKEIPVFKLHLPAKIDGVKVPGSRITFTENLTIEADHNWSIKVFGTGMGYTQMARVFCSAKAIAENEQCKIVYVSIPILITKVAVIDGSKPITYILRTEVAPKAAEVNFHNTAKPSTSEDCQKDKELIGPPSDVFTLIKSPSGSITPFTVKWAYGNGRMSDIEVKAFGINTSMPIRIYRWRELCLDFELPGGYDFILMPLKNHSGIKWEVDETGGWVERRMGIKNRVNGRMLRFRDFLTV